MACSIKGFLFGSMPLTKLNKEINPAFASAIKVCRRK